MRYPKSLNKGGTIGFVAPSFGCATEPYISGFKAAQATLKDMGYGLVLGPNCYSAEGVGISNTPKKCGDELTQYYCSKENDVLISCGGGELMCTILDYVDFDRIKNAEPKWYMGYSDNTNFTFLLSTICDVASVYAPCISTFGMQPWHKSLEDAFGILTGDVRKVSGYEGWERESLKSAENPAPQFNITNERVIKIYDHSDKKVVSSAEYDGEIRFSGRLIGGCLDILVTLLGTKYDRVEEFSQRYKEDGIIWFFEACDLNVMSIRRAMWQLNHSGWFKYVKGFVFGRPYCMGEEMMGMDQYKAVVDELAGYNVPIIMDVDLGHLPPMMPVICGSVTDVSLYHNEIFLEYKLK